MRLACLMLAACSALHAQRWDTGIAAWSLFAGGPGGDPQTGSGINAPAQGGATTTPAPRLRITASRQPLSVLRAVAGERVPEGAALYSIRACSISADPLAIDPGQIEQAMEQQGVALSTRSLAQLAVRRGRSRGLSVLAKFAEGAGFAAPVVVGFAAGGTLRLTGWQVAAVSAFGEGVRIISEATRGERDNARASVGDLGAWLTDMPTIALAAGECSPRMIALGSFDPAKRTLVIER